jgi:hypothetical protein
MKRLAKHGTILIVALIALLGTATYMHRGASRPSSSADTLLLLIPDSIDPKDPLVQEWVDAAEEEGVHLQIVTDSTLLDPMFQFHAAGLIVPDQVHRNANDALIGALHEYVHRGGKLMLVYDACTLDLNGYFPKYESRLSDLVGVSYALYDKFKKNTMELDQVWGSQQTMEDLEVPPGKYIPMTDASEKPGWLQQVAWNAAPRKQPEQRKFTFARYLYNDLKYPAFRTSGTYSGKVLLESSAGIVAGQKRHGQGDVLFVNLPLGYLESRTDGLLLHSFLHYFATHLLQLPYLAPVPDGTGGLVLNWHVDAASALKPMAVLRKAGIFDQGPFSVDFTAGPDVNTFNDGKGLDVDHNPETQSWIRFFLARGDVVGSHGGWIHNYFGENLTDSDEKEFAKYLFMNDQALEHVAKRPVREYSAPLGNHPRWVTEWLEQHGFVGYYFSGDTGMGPTRVYRDDGRDGSIWAFPILHLGTEASLEEMNWDDVPESAVRGWLRGIADYTANDHVARLVYSHPLGATRYVPVLQDWLQHTRELAGENRFRWYTMSGLADFLNTRKDVDWTFSRSGGKFLLQANHPKTLEHQTWILPKSQYRNLHVVQGKASIEERDGSWLVTAKDCRHLAIEVEGIS